MPTNTGTDPRVKRASSLLAEYLRGGRQRTDLLRDIAEIIVDLRQSHTVKDGRPDLGGRSAAYRRDVMAIYEGANVPRDDYDGIQTALRYHVNNRLHEIRTPDELTAAGLGQLSARERLAHDREAAQAVRAALKDPVLLAARIADLAELLDGATLAAEPAKRAKAARMALEEASGHIAATVEAINERHPRRGKRV